MVSAIARWWRRRKACTCTPLVTKFGDLDKYERYPNPNCKVHRG